MMCHWKVAAGPEWRYYYKNKEGAVSLLHSTIQLVRYECGNLAAVTSLGAVMQSE